ncbi:MAG: CTP synthase [Pelagibacteraceae bacterium]|jgi:CTP synthase|nr:CTP synthase [Pelagibacteraceae bacterium]
MARYIFVTGGVVSSLGKGLTSASLASLLQLRGYKVRIRKLDPYLNVDPGTMNPFEHGEVFVTDDGAETDLDLGHYERFTDKPSTRGDNITTGQIYKDIIEKERRGEYLGSTVQIIPHVTNHIKKFISNRVSNEDFVICEIGGTVGDIESLPFLEAIRQFSNEEGRNKSLFIHLTLVPYIGASGELKTKPTQHSVKELRSIGIQPDIIICRSEKKIPKEEKRKISLFCNVEPEHVIQSVDVKSIYEVPIKYDEEKLDKKILKTFGLKEKNKADLKIWKDIVLKINSKRKKISIAIVGKYVDLKDAYKSLDEALIHGSLSNDVELNTEWVDSTKINKNNVSKILKDFSAILIPGGFGSRGTEGKIEAITYARKYKVPFFGICFGMQMAIIESARNMLGIKKATSSEFGKSGIQVIGLMNQWIRGKTIQKGSRKNLGGTMRLGSYKAKLKKNSLISKIYNSTTINERHRHRYEVDKNLKSRLEKKGLIFSGLSPDGSLPETVELENHPWFIGVQFHPEFKSRPFAPHPLFSSFIKAAKNNSEKND